MEEKEKVEQFLEICKQCDAFFKEVLDGAIQNQRLKISDNATFYLMGVLVMGFKRGPETDLIERYLLARETRAFRAIGDDSLMIAGVWWQSLLRKLVDVDYYIEIGSDAYRKAGESTSKNTSEIFEELSENFRDIANVMVEATRCISEADTSDVNILRLYEFWLRTHNSFIEKKLRGLGINPVDIKTTKQ